MSEGIDKGEFSCILTSVLMFTFAGSVGLGIEIGLGFWFWLRLRPYART